MRDAVKLAVHLIATVLVAPMLLSFAIRARFFGRDIALQGSTQALARVPGLSGICLRRAFLARVLPRCARTATIDYGVLFSHAGARIGDHAYIGPYCTIGFAEIEQDVLIAAGVRVPSGRHGHAFDDVERPIREQQAVRDPVRVGRGSWIGAGAVVMADVGADTVIGAGAVVTSPIEDRVVAAGVPARVVRRR